MASSQILVEIVGHETVTPAVGAATGALGGLTGSIGGVTAAFTSAAAAAAKMAAATAAIGIGAVAAGMGSAITSAAGFEKQISAIGAVSGATATQLDGIRTVALQLGKDTSFSAAEAARGMEEIIKAGVSLEAAMGGGAAAVLNLAAATGTEVPRSAEVMSNAMNVFKVSGENASHVADLLTQASNASSTSVHELGYSLAAGGSAAAAAGISLEDTVTTMALLAEAGIKGSDAGTSFKTMILSLTPQAGAATDEMRKLGIVTADGANQFFTAEGKAKSMSEMAGVLSTAMAGLSKEQQIVALKTMFGTDAFRLAQVMMDNSSAGYDRMTGKMDASGNAQDSSTIRLNNLAGSMEKLKGSVETVGIAFGTPFLGPLKRGADALTDVVNRAEPFITALGVRMAAGLDALITRFMAAIPQFQRFGSMLTEGIAIASAYASTLIEMAQSFDLGGGIEDATGFVGALTGALKELAPVAMAIGRAFVDNVTTQLQFLTTAVIPPVVSMAMQLGQMLMTTLLPAAAQTGATMRSILGPTLAWLADDVFPNLMSIVKQTTDFFTMVMLPTFPAIAAALRTTLGATIQWLASDVWPMLHTAATVAWTFIAGTIIPQIPALAAQLRTLLGGALQWLGTTAWPVLLAGATAAWDFIGGTIIPHIPAFVAMLRTALGTALQWLGETGWPMLVKGATVAWDFLQNKVIPVVQDVVKWLRDTLPAAIQTVTTTFEALRGKVQPIIEAVFSGDIKAAIQGIGSAFSEFATLAMEWLGEQVEQIDWAAIWAVAVDIGTELGTYLLGLTVDFLTWLQAQVAAVDWAAVWSTAVDIGTQLGTYVLGLAVDFASWLSAQVALIDWAAVWASAVTAATALGTYLLGLVVDFATWLKAQVALIPWPEVWATATTIATDLGTYLLGLVIDFATWLNQEVAKIPWPEVWATATTAATALNAYLLGLAIEFLPWLQQEVAKIDWVAVWSAATQAATQTFQWLTTMIQSVDWATLGQTLATQFTEMFTTGVSTTDWNRVGQDTATLLGAMLGTAIAAEQAWAAFKQGLIDGFARAITGTSPTEAATALGGWLDGVIKAAWDGAIARFKPSWPSWMPGGTPAAPGGAAPGGGEAPGAAGGGRQGTTSSTPVSNASSREEKIARAKELAISRGLDPELFAAQLMQESSFDPTAYAPNNAGGARGIGQFTPGTGGAYAARMGVTYEQMVADADLSMQAAAMHMEDLTNQFGGNQERALSAYYSGPGGGVHPDYVSAIRSRLPQVAGVQPRQGTTPQEQAPGGAMVTYRDQWGNEFTTTEDKFNQRPGGNADVEVIGRTGVQQAGNATKMGGMTGIDATQFAIGNQFELGLPWDAAAAACGPAAAAIFYQATGRTPNAREVMQIASRNGWTAAAGMGGPGNFMGMLGDMGVGAAIDYTPTAAELQASVQGGSPTAISTQGGNVPLSSGHYFVAQGYNQDTGEYDLGETGGGPGNALKGGSRFMTLEQITAIAGPMNALITLTDQAAVSFKTMSESVEQTNVAAAATTPELSSIGAAIDPVVASFDQGATSATGLTDAIIASAAGSGVATESAAAYSEGLIGQDEALRGVLAGFAETTPAAAELLAQMDAGSISTEQAAVAFAGLSTSTAVATGALTTMATDGGAAVDGLATGAVASFGSMQTGALTAADLMNTGVVTAAGLMSAGVLAAGDVMENGTLTSAGLMKAGTITAAELMQAGVVSEAQLMQAETALAADTLYKDVTGSLGDTESEASTSADTMYANVTGSTADLHTEGAADIADFATDTETSMGDAKTAATTAADETKTGVVTATGEMATDAGGNIETFAGTADTEFGNVETSAKGAAKEMTAVGKVEIPAPDTSEIESGFKDIENAAKKAESAVQKLANSVGKVGGSVGGSLGAKAAGGLVAGAHAYIVGERGPELFVPGMSGWIIPNDQLERLRATMLGGLAHRAGGGPVIGGSASSGGTAQWAWMSFTPEHLVSLIDGIEDVGRVAGESATTLFDLHTVLADANDAMTVAVTAATDLDASFGGLKLGAEALTGHLADDTKGLADLTTGLGKFSKAVGDLLDLIEEPPGTPPAKPPTTPTPGEPAPGEPPDSGPGLGDPTFHVDPPDDGPVRLPAPTPVPMPVPQPIVKEVAVIDYARLGAAVAQALDGNRNTYQLTVNNAGTSPSLTHELATLEAIARSGG